MTRLRLDRVRYVVGEKSLVDGVSLDVAPGEVVGLVGPNGSGKSTLLRAVYRVNRPTEGRVLLDGHDIWRQRPRWVAQRIGVVPQDAADAFPLTVRDLVAMGRSAHKRPLSADDAHDRAVTDAALELLGLTGLAGRRLGSLSGGERQRALIARALTGQPSLLVMDEPTNHLDPRHQLEALRLVTDLGVSALIALHDLNLAALFCHRLCLLDAGRPAATGTPRQVLTPERIAAVYQVDAIVTDHPRTGTPLVVVA